MALSAKLQLRQSQALVMTPQLLQSIRLLQYSNAELQAFVERQMESNPLLIHSPAAADAAVSVGSGEVTGEARSDSAGYPGAAPSAVANGIGGPASRRSANQAFSGDSEFGIEDLADRRPSLHAHAAQEVADILEDADERRIGEELCEHLDESGYVYVSAAEIAAQLRCPIEAVERTLQTIQRDIAPAGLFARSLAECLAIQLKRQNRFDPVIAIVLDHLDLLARRDFSALRRLTGEDEAGLMEILAEIRGLDPKPGHAFDHDGSEVIVPDVFVSESADGTWQVELNPDALPRVIVDNAYLTTVRDGATREADQAFLGECQQSANWLVRSLDQRAKTILKVASEIVRRQDGFLTRGVGGLKPMTLMSVAEAIGMHESTVSRVTSTKYIATPRGTFEMRFFFTVAIASADGGDAHSAESVKHRIKILIDAESVGKVMSDDDIAVVLKKEGIDLARRTVAKYREALGIPSSIQRRREMNARQLAS
ncbi:RNA polymerase factor sigma-54 [Jiella sp. MQZ9-1]|uniref:RNA polymerase sigma-54 factor n=1 Tax=Jiella flava TaxID=2816857 RepID=A0A939JVQ4_9HYPH|nr:RNA polymerase factor sigma-54 [Jiella flava]MBO0661506.1 RNA polymerase factor sigma-54 [Jiella flava]MCD2470148.1 RNA polymerase factor sigma-54 [Jiella flava]